MNAQNKGSGQNGTDVIYTYDNLGRPTVVTQELGIANGSNVTLAANQHAYLYDPLTLALDKETISYGNGLSRTLDRSQDQYLRPDRIALINGTQVDQATAYSYDAAGRLNDIQSLELNTVGADPLLATSYSPLATFGYSYLANSGSLVQSVTGPAHTVTNTYEATRNVLQQKRNTAGDLSQITNTPISNFVYGVNDLGQRADVSRSGSAFPSANTETWNYNAKGEVTKADHSTNNAFDRSFQFDSIGNRKKSADSLTLPASDNYTSNALNQYSAVGVVARTFDDDGNLTDDGTKQFVWDAENRLIEVQNKSDSSTVARYAYDFGSRRITKTIGSTVANYVYDGYSVLAEYSGTTLSNAYTWGLDLSGSVGGAAGVGGLLSVNDGSTTYFPSFDGNGNVSEYLNALGAPVAHYEYDTFGRVIVSTGIKKNDFGHQFSTKMFDAETGFNKYTFRLYDSAVGRWISRDSVNEIGGLNLYGFINNRGVNGYDIKGNFGPIGALIGIAVDYSIQVSINYACGKRGSEAWTEIDGTSLLVSAVAGGLGAPGLGGAAFKTFKNAKKIKALQSRIQQSRKFKKLANLTKRQQKMQRRLQRKLDDVRNLHKDYQRALSFGAASSVVQKIIKSAINDVQEAMGNEESCCQIESIEVTISLSEMELWHPNTFDMFDPSDLLGIDIGSESIREAEEALRDFNRDNEMLDLILPPFGGFVGDDNLQ